MNIHGHKKKLNRITRTIKKELEKHKNQQNGARLKHLNLARVKHRNKIRELLDKKPKKRKRIHRKQRGQKNKKC